MVQSCNAYLRCDPLRLGRDSSGSGLCLGPLGRFLKGPICEDDRLAMVAILFRMPGCFRLHTLRQGLGGTQQPAPDGAARGTTRAGHAWQDGVW